MHLGGGLIFYSKYHILYLIFLLTKKSIKEIHGVLVSPNKPAIKGSIVVSTKFEKDSYEYVGIQVCKVFAMKFKI